MPVEALTVGTDGACIGNPGPAGWAWVDEHGNYHASGQAHGTNNIAELSAVLSALRDHPGIERLFIQIDSTYARDCSTTWRAGWDAEPATTLTYTIAEKANGVTCLTVTHELNGAPNTAAMVGGSVDGAGGGWAEVLSDLKTLLETGVSLFAPDVSEQSR